ncbi:MAG: BatA and WFA domain-containing protein [Bacteroidales bacterium]|nr:BatA and WFA domain-containing protein [Bacteroidales bacterium]
MFFTNPAILWGLFAILIPIAIHLFYFRKFKKTYFSNVRLLQSIQNQTQNQSKLKHLLVLFCRILTIIFLVFAFAQPNPKTALKPLVGEGVNYVSVVIDNSFSMGTNTDRGTLLDQAKQKARELVSKFKPTDRFALITQDFWGDSRRFVSMEEMLYAIERVDIVPFSNSLSELVARQKSLYQNISGRSTALFMISDFQRTMVDIENLISDTILQTWFIPVQSQVVNNISIDSVSIETPIFQVGGEIEFQIWLTNHGEQSLQEIPVKLLVNNNIVSIGNVNFEPRQTKTIRRNLTLQEPGYLQGRVEISDHPITFDDRLYFTLNVLEEIPVLIITEETPNQFLMRLLANDPSFDLTVQNVRNLDFSMLHRVNFVILDEIKTLSSGLQTELQTAIDAGLNVLILPGEQTYLTSINNLTKQLLSAEYKQIKKMQINVDAILSDHPIYRSAFVRIPENLLLPEVQKYFPIQVSARSNLQHLLRLSNRDPFLSFGNVGKGRVYLSAVPFDNAFSNFQNQPLFVVSVLNMILQSASNEQIYNLLTQQEAIIHNVGAGHAPPLFLQSENSDFEMIPQVTFRGNQLFINTFSSLRDAGNYILRTRNEVVAKLSYNFDRRESDLRSYSRSELEHLLGQHHLSGFSVLGDNFVSVDGTLFAVSTRIPWWKWCLLFALLFLLAEAFILRLFR